MADLSKAGISILKVRTSYAEVGNPPQFITGPNYSVKNGVVTTQTYAPATYLRPERTKSFEVGLNAKFLGNKFWLDATYYDTNTCNQLFLYATPSSTGYKLDRRSRRALHPAQSPAQRASRRLDFHRRTDRGINGT